MKIVKTASLIIIAAAILTGTIACSKSKNNGNSTSQSTAEMTTGHPSVSSDTNSDINTPTSGVHAEPHSVWEQYTDGDEQLILYSINCPVFSGNSEWNFDKINSTLEAYCKEYSRISENDRISSKEDHDFLGDRFESYEKAADYTFFVKDDVISVRFDAYESTGGADDLWMTTAFCFDLKSGERIDLAAFLGKDADFAKQYAINAFSLLIKTSPDNYFDNAAEQLSELLDGYCFYLNDTGLVLFLNSCTIAPDAFGQQTVTVAYANLPK